MDSERGKREGRARTYYFVRVFSSSPAVALLPLLPCCFILLHLLGILCVHNTQRSYTQSLCSLTLNHSIAYPVLKTMFVHLHAHTRTHSSMFHTQFTVVVVIVFPLPLMLLLLLVLCAAGWLAFCVYFATLVHGT